MIIMLYMNNGFVEQSISSNYLTCMCVHACVLQQLLQRYGLYLDQTFTQIIK